MTRRAAAPIIWVLAMVFAALCWSGAFIAGKIGVRSASPLALTYFRFLLALVCIYGFARAKGVSLRIRARDWRVMLLLGLVGMVAYHLLFFQALRYTTAIKTSMIAATNPLMTAVLAVFLLGERLNRAKLVCFLGALGGVLLTISHWHPAVLLRGGVAPGDLIMLAAVLCWALYGILVRRQVGRFDPVVTTFYSFLVCVLVLTPFQAFEIATGGCRIRPEGWLAIAYMGIFPTCCGYLIQQQAIKHIGVSRAALFINLVPVLVMVLAVVVLGESFLPLNLVSAAMIILSVLGFNLMAAPAPRP